MDSLIRDHIQSNKLGPVCGSLTFGLDTRSETLPRAILAKNPHKSVQAEASLALAEILNTRLDLAKRIKDDPKTLAFLEAFAGMEVAEELRNEDLAALATAAEKAYTEFAEKYSADVPTERLTWACMRLSSAEGKAATGSCSPWKRTNGARFRARPA